MRLYTSNHKPDSLRARLKPFLRDGMSLSELADQFPDTKPGTLRSAGAVVRHEIAGADRVARAKRKAPPPEKPVDVAEVRRLAAARIPITVIASRFRVPYRVILNIMDGAKPARG